MKHDEDNSDRVPLIYTLFIALALSGAFYLGAIWCFVTLWKVVAK